MERPNNAQASCAQNPDLDWSQVRETVLMLNLAMTRMTHAMRDGDESVDHLSRSFTEMVGHVKFMQDSVTAMVADDTRNNLLDHCTAIRGQVDSAIMAFQFYDRLSQRMQHVSNSLEALSKLVESPQRLYNPIEWKALQELIRANYTLDSDKAMFEALLQGKSIEDIMKQACSEAEENDIELF
ncbi:hypothetical protein [Sulfuriflexus mobilis]|uniref:hypothetical protein n=1 Tax=Sulfuriflexus mobilis TaxID=1811807 RepID=UPI000F82DC68|nr:hypothetical protein [Sulfuriflexus mobilis]